LAVDADRGQAIAYGFLNGLERLTQPFVYSAVVAVGAGILQVGEPIRQFFGAVKDEDDYLW
jgi:hypothetical protein